MVLNFILDRFINVQMVILILREPTTDEAFESCLRAVQIFPVKI